MPPGVSPKLRLNLLQTSQSPPGLMSCVCVERDIHCPLTLSSPCSASTVVAVPVVLGAVGFTSTGITASSLAAKMMSISAIANGGGVAAGSLVATLQSVGKGLGRMRGGRNRGEEGPTSTSVGPRLSLREGGSLPSSFLVLKVPGSSSLPHCSPESWVSLPGRSGVEG